MARVERSQIAAEDLIEIWLHIAQDNPAAADQLLDQIDGICSMLARLPLLGRARDELAAGLRSFPVGNYIIFYRPTKAGVVVVRVLSGYRDLDELFR